MRISGIILLLFLASGLMAQLKPGFEINEYLGTIRRSARQVDSNFRKNVPPETEFSRVYRSPIMGLDNKYDIWLNKDKSIMALNLRGTMDEKDSWLENFYSAMIPATGSLQLTDSFTFNYRFAADPRAAVHVGWAIGIGSLAPDIKDKVLHFYGIGVHQLIIEGHSQGGALAFLLTSYLRYLQIDGVLPKDLIIKTYCSAGPKPGNEFFAYDYDFITRGGWAFNVVNARDWVPETPATVQTVKDFNKISPFTNVQKMAKGHGIGLRLAAGYVYKRISNPAFKTRKRYANYLGKIAYKQVKHYIPQLKKPKYVKSFNFVRAGVPIILEPDEEYYKNYPDTGDNIFRHHLFGPYYYQASRIYVK